MSIPQRSSDGTPSSQYHVPLYPAFSTEYSLPRNQSATKIQGCVRSLVLADLSSPFTHLASTCDSQRPECVVRARRVLVPSGTKRYGYTRYELRAESIGVDLNGVVEGSPYRGTDDGGRQPTLSPRSRSRCSRTLYAPATKREKCGVRRSISRRRRGRSHTPHRGISSPCHVNLVQSSTPAASIMTLMEK